MRILVAADAWLPQVNGVVRTLCALAEAAPAHGATIEFLTPERRRRHKKRDDRPPSDTR